MPVAPSPLREVAPGLHVCEAPQRFLGLEMGARMTVLALPDGVLVHSPVAVSPASVASLGPLRGVVAPNLLHHLHAGPWVDAAESAWAAPGLPDKRPDLAFDGTLDTVGEPFGDSVLAVPLACFDMTREVVLLHRPSRTLVVTDLVFHIQPDAPWATRAAMWAMGGYPGCGVTALERLGMRRDVARTELRFLLGLDFDRVVMAHGAVVETGGKAALESAFAWLW